MRLAALGPAPCNQGAPSHEGPKRDRSNYACLGPCVGKGGLALGAHNRTDNPLARLCVLLLALPLASLFGGGFTLAFLCGLIYAWSGLLAHARRLLPGHIPRLGTRIGPVRLGPRLSFDLPLRIYLRVYLRFFRLHFRFSIRGTLHVLDLQRSHLRLILSFGLKHQVMAAVAVAEHAR